MTPAWQKSLMALTATVIGVVIVGALYWAQAVFIPVALAVFLAFLLNPWVRHLQRLRLNRTIAATMTVLTATVLLGSLAWLFARQTTEFVADLPKYSENIRDKIQALRGWGAGAQQMIKEINEDLKTKPIANDAPPDKPRATAAAREERPTPVVVQTEISGWLTTLYAYLGSMLLASAGFVLVMVLVFFILLRWEDLRGRFLRLVGRGRMSLTTKAFDDASHRISRFLIMQLVVNAFVGLAVAVGLLLIGVEHAMLWGLLAALLRYVPYVGIWIAALMLSVICLAVFPGWMPAVLVISLFLVVEFFAGNLLEPRLYGQSIGVSEVAFLIAAAFWGFLWGPIGLVLSSPLTVCLLVLGKRVPALKFLDVVLGDEPVLNPQIVFYQRLLARDQDEAANLVLTQAQADGETVYDELLLPALSFAKQDRVRGELTEADEEFVQRAIHEMLEDLDHNGAHVAAVAEHTPDPVLAPVRLLAIPARFAADQLALEMLPQLLDPAKWQVEITPAGPLVAELTAQAVDARPQLICIGALAPGGLSRARHLCKRLRGQFPDIKILVGRWGSAENGDAEKDLLCQTGADSVATSLVETRNQLNSWFSVLAQSPPRAAAG